MGFMMEIKFRSWSDVNEAMYYDSEYTFVTGGRPGYLTVRDKYGGLVIGNCSQTMQYIGLKDVAGKEIYEGDIISMENASAQVVYDPPAFILDYSHNESEWCDDWDLSDCHRMEIIGNIYENPELLK
jgi:hypothetical protein